MNNDILSCYVKFCVNRKTNFASVKETVTLAHFAVACLLLNSIFSEVIKTLHRRFFITSAPCKRGSQPTFGQAELSSRICIIYHNNSQGTRWITTSCLAT